MLDDDDSYSDLGQPTELDSWKHQSELLCEEIADLNRRLQRSQQNISKLVDINAEISAERENLRIQLDEATTRISDCLRKAAIDWAQINTLKHVKQQVDVLRQERQELLDRLDKIQPKAHL